MGMRLRGKVALVTGSSSGIGAAIAKGMATEGADVVVNYNRNQDGALATADAARSAGRQALVIQADVGQADPVDEMFEEIRGAFGRLDILVNNAGITLKRPFEESDEADWDRIISANLKGVFLCSRRALDLMPSGGSILNISSVHASTTTHNFSVYAASKGGLESLTRSMAIELGERGIRVNALRLGWIQVERDHIDLGDPSYGTVCRRIPLGRPGEVADVVPMAIHLCSREAGYITGQVICIDGGHETILNTAFPKGHCDGGARD